jgi:hypothetical protein
MLQLEMSAVFAYFDSSKAVKGAGGRSSLSAAPRPSVKTVTAEDSVSGTPDTESQGLPPPLDPPRPGLDADDDEEMDDDDALTSGAGQEAIHRVTPRDRVKACGKLTGLELLSKPADFLMVGDTGPEKL